MGRGKILTLVSTWQSTIGRHKCTMSSLYRPVNLATPPPKDKGRHKDTKDATEHVTLSRSLKLMVDNGIIRPSSCPGAFHYLPLGNRSLEKLVRIVDHFMEKADCQKIQMPILTSTTLWNKTGRIDECDSELMIVSDRHSKRFLLSPTHEEAVCDLVNAHPISHRQLPLRLYQITEKFRDEKRPRFGLMRSRQFLMKDLYTFDTNDKNAEKTYDEIINIYEQLFSALGLNWIKALGCTGTIGGKQSHEFHLMSDVGEDNLIHCHGCHSSFNEELLNYEIEVAVVAASSGSSQNSVPKSDPPPNPICVNCGSSDLSSSKSIEIGHAFLLGTKYTKPMNTKYVSENSSPVLMEMGCYGIGVSRLLAAIVEVSATENEIRWPISIAPFFLSIIPPKGGSKEEKIGVPLFEKFYAIVEKIFGSDVIIDDRNDQTVGKRLLDAKRLGIPYIAVFGKSVLNETHPLIELQEVNTGKVHTLPDTDVIKILYDAKSNASIT